MSAFLALVGPTASGPSSSDQSHSCVTGEPSAALEPSSQWFRWASEIVALVDSVSEENDWN